MIPEQYWQIARRWFWIILAAAAIGGAAGIFLGPALLGRATTEHNASTTLGVARYLSLSGTITADQSTGGVGPLADYTTNIANVTKTAQYISRLQAALAARGVVLPEARLRAKLRVTPDRGLLRITIETTANDSTQAEALVQEAATLLIDQAAAEEKRTRESLANSQSQTDELISRLADTYKRRTALLNSLGAPSLQIALAEALKRGAGGGDVVTEFRRIVQDMAVATSDPNLAAVNAEVQALETELADNARNKELLNLALKGDKPVFVLNPVDTVAVEGQSPVRTRDLLILGTGGGLLLGWLMANTLERSWNNRQARLAAEPLTMGRKGEEVLTG